MYEGILSSKQCLKMKIPLYTQSLKMPVEPCTGAVQLSTHGSYCKGFLSGLWAPKMLGPGAIATSASPKATPLEEGRYHSRTRCILIHICLSCRTIVVLH